MPHSNSALDASVTIRRAVREDARDIARLFLMSSDGLAKYIWGKQAAPLVSPLDVGEERYRRENTAFSYQNCLIAEQRGQVAGMLHAYKMPTESEPETDPILKPYSELEVPGSFYISSVAVFEPYRGIGVASQLMDSAEAIAQVRGMKQLSLLCFDRNLPALRLHLRRGYGLIDQRPLVPHPCLHYSEGNAFLLLKELETDVA